MDDFMKAAYALGSQQALLDYGLSKTAGDVIDPAKLPMGMPEAWKRSDLSDVWNETMKRIIPDKGTQTTVEDIVRRTLGQGVIADAIEDSSRRQKRLGAIALGLAGGATLGGLGSLWSDEARGWLNR